MAGRQRNQGTREPSRGSIRIALAALFLVSLGVWPDVAAAQQALRSGDHHGLSAGPGPPEEE